MYLNCNNLYGYGMTKKLSTGKLQWVEYISIFTEGFIKISDKNSDTGYLLVVDVAYPKNLHECNKYLPFYLIGLKSIKPLSFHVILMIKIITL